VGDNMGNDMDARFRAITHKLWGPKEGEEIYQWIVATRPPAFHEKLIEVMVPIWEMDKVDLKIKILCAISLFTGLHRDEAEYFFKMAAYHQIPQEEVEEILMLTGLEAGFPTAEKAIVTMKTVYDEHAAKQAAK
jgi:alkylhydroperoxidase/carboxymuconolactone decarboxylase family protein YurZ